MGVSGFFYHLKNNYPSVFTKKNSIKYDYLILDYHSLFHNIKNLYDEINYFIRLLFEAKYQYQMGNDYFFKSYNNKNIKSDPYYIIEKIVNTYKNLFNIIGININNIRFSPNNININIKKINKILKKFPITEDVIKNAMIMDIVEHTIFLANSYTHGISDEIRFKNTLIYFDGIPSVSKIKEQLSRRIGLTVFKMITQDIVKSEIIRNDTPHMRASESEIREKLLLSFPPIDLNSPLINETRDILIAKGFNVNDKMRYGEAEHQLMKDLTLEKYKNAKILLSSPDADLILLCMLSHVFNNTRIDIYRETVLNPSNFEFNWKYDIKKNYSVISPYMRDIVFININRLIKELGLSSSQQILDIAYLILLLGDDFIPIIPTLNVKALDNILTYYHKLKLPIINTTINITISKEGHNVYSINYTNMTKFITMLSFDENKLMENKKKQFNNKVKQKSKSILENYTKYIKFMNSTDNIIIKKIFYLENGMIIKDDGMEELLITEFQDPTPLPNSIILNYIQGYQFIFDLYFLNNIKNYKWLYPYDTAPTLKEIALFLNGIDIDKVESISYNDINPSLNLEYFDFFSYKKYIDDNKNKILRNIIKNIIFAKKIVVDQPIEKYFTYENVIYIYKCVNALYITHCIHYDKMLIDPNIKEYNCISPMILGGGMNTIKYNYYMKYKKYKQKYILLAKAYS